MCELKVRLNTPTKVEEAAHDVVYAQLETDHVLVKNVLGDAQKIPNALILTVDIGSESLSLRQSPLLRPFLRFLEACDHADAALSYAEAEQRWQDLKVEGDELVRSLWRKYGRSPLG